MYFLNEEDKTNIFLTRRIPNDIYRHLPLQEVELNLFPPPPGCGLLVSIVLLKNNQWKEKTSNSTVVKPGKHCLYSVTNVLVMPCGYRVPPDVTGWEGLSLCGILSQTNNPRAGMRKSSDKPNSREILQNPCPVLLKKWLWKTRKDWATVTDQRRRGDGRLMAWELGTEKRTSVYKNQTPNKDFGVFID